MAVPTKRATIDEEYWQRFRTSAELFARAKNAIPSGVTHDSRAFSPFPVYMSHAAGAYKWDKDGNKLLDHWMGHGALLLGHNHPTVTQAVIEALGRGTHLGACHEEEIEWADLVRKLIPSAEEVRFTMSGTEATMLAMRNGRAYTGKPKVLRFQGHFHGWHDYALCGYQYPYEIPTSAGVPDAVKSTMVIVPPSDLAAVERALDADDQIGTVILEATGGSWGKTPHAPGFLQGLRDVTARRGVVLIFDEVISGFRWSPGGAQQFYGVTPDLTTMAKIVAGGLPGGAVAGKAEIMGVQAVTGDAKHDRFQRVFQNGTHNNNLPCVAAGVAALRIVAEGEATDYCSRLAATLRAGLAEKLRARGVAGVVYGETSAFHLVLGEGFEQTLAARDHTVLQAGRPTNGPLRRAMLLEGVDLMGTSGFTSTAHTEADLELTIGAFDRALERMQAEGLV